jgi:hypothetical protein
MDGKMSSGTEGGGWTIGILLIGLTAIGVCVVIPQADTNRRLAYERSKLQADLQQINEQASVNEAFLSKIESDPQLAQRLAQRQMKFIRQGESLLPIKSSKPADYTVAAEISPFSLVRVPPPPALPPYEAAGGLLGQLLLDSHLRLYCLGGGLFLVAMALVLGSNEPHEARLGT